jgi:hypothetical protein
MTETSEIGPLARRRRGVAPGTFLIWIILAAVGGAVVWAIYGDGVRSILKLPPASAHWAITQTNQNQPTATNLNELVGLVKDLQASQQRTADDVRTTLQLLTSEQAATQAATKTVSDAMAALQAKVDALQRPVVPATKNPAPVAARKPPAAARPAPESTEPEQPELDRPLALRPGSSPGKDLKPSVRTGERQQKAATGFHNDNGFRLLSH